MKFAILGTDVELLAVARAAIAEGHSIVWLGDVRPEDAATVIQSLPGLPESIDWESLLDPRFVDGVLVGRGKLDSESREESIKRLVTDGIPLLIMHPMGRSVLLYYELDMLRRDQESVLQHYNPQARFPLEPELARWVREGHDRIGPVHQVTCQRSLADWDRDSVLSMLARDAEMLQAVAGDIHRASAIGPRELTDSYASLQVQMTAGSGDASLRWTVVPASHGTGAELTLVGERGQALLRFPDDKMSSGNGSIETKAEGLTDSEPLATWNGPQRAITQFAAALDKTAKAEPTEKSTWSTAIQAMEVVDAVELSLQKGRTIEVQHQQLTEQLAFRGTMSALGCGLLLFGMMVLVVAGLLGDALGIPFLRDWIRYWPQALLALLGFFLLLQIVPWLGESEQESE